MGADDDKLAAASRHKRIDDATGKLLYEWDQTLDEVNVYVPIDVQLNTKTDLKVRITGKTMEIENAKEKESAILPKLEFYRQTIADETVWTRDRVTGEMHVQLVKLKKAEPWEAVFAEHCDERSANATERDRQRMMLSRFQQENPGFDFSDAEFEVGKEVPDASEWNLK